jgi:NADH-quinone oxidoreductase subunit J
VLETLFFYAIAAFTLTAAYFVVTAHNLFRSAMGLTASLIGVAGLYLLMDAQFLSAIQIAVYVGGVVVLIVFAVLMVADVTQKVFLRASGARIALASGIAALLFAVITTAIRSQGFAAAPEGRAASVHEIGRALLGAGAGGFVLPFEAVSLVLIAALVGAITVAGGRDDADDGGEGGERR